MLSIFILDSDAGTHNPPTRTNVSPTLTAAFPSHKRGPYMRASLYIDKDLPRIFIIAVIDMTGCLRDAKLANDDQSNMRRRETKTPL